MRLHDIVLNIALGQKIRRKAWDYLRDLDEDRYVEFVPTGMFECDACLEFFPDKELSFTKEDMLSNDWELMN